MFVTIHGYYRQTSAFAFTQTKQRYMVRSMADGWLHRKVITEAVELLWDIEKAKISGC